MTDKDILISDLNDISEILNNNGYCGWCVAIRKAVELLKEQDAVVRCKDCKHLDPEDHHCDSGHDIVWQLSRRDDWFCADGEKRTD